MLEISGIPHKNSDTPTSTLNEYLEKNHVLELASVSMPSPSTCPHACWACWGRTGGSYMGREFLLGVTGA